MGLCWADNRYVYGYRLACRPCWNKKASWFHLSSQEDVLLLKLRIKSSLRCHAIYHITNSVVSADASTILVWHDVLADLS